LLAEHGDDIAAEIGLPAQVVRQLGVVPSYYLRYFYAHDRVVEEHRGQPTRAQVVTDIERELLAMYEDPRLDTLPELLSTRGGAFYSDAAVHLVASLWRDTGDVQVINVRNRGRLPFLPDDAVIETPSAVGADGATPLPIAPVDPLYAGLISAVSAYERLAVDAAVHGGRERVFRALLAHPLVGQIDLADRLTDLLIAHNRQHLAWARGTIGS
jgi:6-phospho-beta-glucosidase